MGAVWSWILAEHLKKTRTRRWLRHRMLPPTTPPSRHDSEGHKACDHGHPALGSHGFRSRELPVPRQWNMRVTARFDTWTPRAFVEAGGSVPFFSEGGVCHGHDVRGENTASFRAGRDPWRHTRASALERIRRHPRVRRWLAPFRRCAGLGCCAVPEPERTAPDAACARRVSDPGCAAGSACVGTATQGGAEPDPASCRDSRG